MAALDDLDDIEQYRQLFTSVDFWTPYVQKVCQRHQLTPAGPVRTGVPGTCPSFIVAERWVVKFFGRLFDGGKCFAAEEEAGRLASLDPAIPVARVITQGELRRADWPWPYLVFPFIPGKSLGEQADQIDETSWQQIAAEAGEFARRLHALPLAGSTVFPDHLDSYRAFLETQRAACAANHRRWGTLPHRLIDQIEHYLPPLETLVDDDRPAHLIHADLTRDHLLGTVENRRWHTLALIDFGDAMTGDFLYELSVAHLDLFRADRKLLGIFLDAYGLKSEARVGLPHRVMATALLHQFNLFCLVPQEILQAQTLEELEQALFGLF
jgi:hypothetical protein